MIWFNPPFSLNVSTNIVKKFFSRLGKNFLKMYQLHKLFNRNDIKVIYSSLRNFKSVINVHNKNVLNEQEKPSPCICRVKTSCPSKGSCQYKNLVYFCKVLTPDLKQNHPHYIALTEHTFKDRLYKHNASFKYRSKRNSAELNRTQLKRNFIWDKKKETINVDLDRSFLDKAKPYSPATKKMHVMTYREISHHFLYKESIEQTQ